MTYKEFASSCVFEPWGTRAGFLKKEIKADEILSGLITETIQNRIEMLEQELVELGVEMEELENEHTEIDW